jgi:hypothetical protein
MSLSAPPPPPRLASRAALGSGVGPAQAPSWAGLGWGDCDDEQLTALLNVWQATPLCAAVPPRGPAAQAAQQRAWLKPMPPAKRRYLDAAAGWGGAGL